MTLTSPRVYLTSFNTIAISNIFLMKEQERRFKQRIKDPRKIWKLSPMDLESYRRWYDYSQARDDMLLATDMDYALGVSILGLIPISGLLAIARPMRKWALRRLCVYMVHVIDAKVV